MKREEFLGLFLGVVTKRHRDWLAEEDTEVGHLDNMQTQLKRHNDDIQKVVIRCGECDINQPEKGEHR